MLSLSEAHVRAILKEMVTEGSVSAEGKTNIRTYYLE